MSDQYVGEIRMIAGTYAPTGWALCDGSSLSIAEYAALYAAIGVTYGQGPTADKFLLPDFRGRVPVHAGTGSGLTPRRCGESLGEERVMLTENDIPVHSHSILLAGLDASGKRDGTSSTPKGNYLADSIAFNLYRREGSTHAMHAEAIGKTGAPRPMTHENMMPTMFINFIIALDGRIADAEGKE